MVGGVLGRVRVCLRWLEKRSSRPPLREGLVGGIGLRMGLRWVMGYLNSTVTVTVSEEDILLDFVVLVGGYGGTLYVVGCVTVLSM